MDTKNLVKFIQSEKNVLFVGPHGCGKTTMVIDAAREANVVLKYFSAATLDPWADLIGIPVPVGSEENKHLKFIRPLDMDEAEMVFFDELNRSHPKVQNAVLEMIQFKSINGVPLPKLKMVWGAMNPAGGKYKVDELDVALEDRFHIHLEIKANPDVKYFTRMDKVSGEQLFNEDEAGHLVSWWNGLTKEAKAIVSPRRLEYFGTLIKDGIHPKLGVPIGKQMNIPVADLLNRFNRTNSGKWNIDQIVASTDDQYQMHVSDRSMALEVSSEILSARVTYLATNLGLAEKIMMLPKEIRQKMYSDLSFRAKIQNKYKSSWTKNCPNEILELISDSYNLNNAILSIPAAEGSTFAQSVNRKCEDYRGKVLAAGKKIRNSITPLSAPVIQEQA